MVCCPNVRIKNIVPDLAFFIAQEKLGYTLEALGFKRATRATHPKSNTLEMIQTEHIRERKRAALIIKQLTR